MNGHINGWAVISRHLLLREKNQSDLARLLHISPAAITQIKRGDFQLNMESLETILKYLGASRGEEEAIYSQIIQSRFCEKLSSGIVCQIIIIRR
jgi:transcriptional regulator with XRE-family HTH domain